MGSSPNAGFFIQSAAGDKGNFEVVIPWPDGGLAHFTRWNDARDFPWSRPTIFGTANYTAACVLQSDWQSSEGKQFNLEVIATTVDGELHEFTRDNGPAFAWTGPIVPPFGSTGWANSPNLCQVGLPVQEERKNFDTALHRPFHFIAVERVSPFDLHPDGGLQYWERFHTHTGDANWSQVDEYAGSNLTGAGLAFSSVNDSDSAHDNANVVKAQGDAVIAATTGLQTLLVLRKRWDLPSWEVAGFDGPFVFGSDMVPEAAGLAFVGQPAILQSDFDYDYGSWPWSSRHFGNYELVAPLLATGIAHFVKSNGSFRFGEQSESDPQNGWGAPSFFGQNYHYDALSIIQSNFGNENLYVVAHRIDDDGFDLYWQDDDFVWQGPTHVAGKRPRPYSAGPIRTLIPYSGHLDLYTTVVNGGEIITTFFEATGGWREWSNIPQGTLFFSTVQVLQPFDGHVDLYATTTEGIPMTAFYQNGSGWSDWFQIGTVPMDHGAPISAMLPYDGHVDVYTTRSDGAVMTAYAQDGSWTEWFQIGTKLMSPGVTVTAQQPYDGHVDLYATTTEGAVMTVFFQNGKGWGDWFQIGSATMYPGATVAALQTFPGHVDLYATNADGAVMWAFFDDHIGWSDWFPIGTTTMAEGTPVTALQPFDGHVDLYATRSDGAAMSAYYQDGVWTDWFTIGTTRLRPGSTITAVAPEEGHVDLFATTADGDILTTYFQAGGDWVEWFPFP